MNVLLDIEFPFPIAHSSFIVQNDNSYFRICDGKSDISTDGKTYLSGFLIGSLQVSHSINLSRGGNVQDYQNGSIEVSVLDKGISQAFLLAGRSINQGDIRIKTLDETIYKGFIIGHSIKEGVLTFRLESLSKYLGVFETTKSFGKTYSQSLKRDAIGDTMAFSWIDKGVSLPSAKIRTLYCPNLLTDVNGGDNVYYKGNDIVLTETETYIEFFGAIVGISSFLDAQGIPVEKLFLAFRSGNNSGLVCLISKIEEYHEEPNNLTITKITLADALPSWEVAQYDYIEIHRSYNLYRVDESFSLTNLQSVKLKDSDGFFYPLNPEDYDLISLNGKKYLRLFNSQYQYQSIPVSTISFDPMDTNAEVTTGNLVNLLNADISFEDKAIVAKGENIHGCEWCKISLRVYDLEKYQNKDLYLGILAEKMAGNNSKFALGVTYLDSMRRQPIDDNGAIDFSEPIYTFKAINNYYTCQSNPMGRLVNPRVNFNPFSLFRKDQFEASKIPVDAANYVNIKTIDLYDHIISSMSTHYFKLGIYFFSQFEEKIETIFIDYIKENDTLESSLSSICNSLISFDSIPNPTNFHLEYQEKTQGIDVLSQVAKEHSIAIFADQEGLFQVQKLEFDTPNQTVLDGEIISCSPLSDIDISQIVNLPTFSIKDKDRNDHFISLISTVPTFPAYSSDPNILKPIFSFSQDFFSKVIFNQSIYNSLKKIYDYCKRSIERNSIEISGDIAISTFYLEEIEDYFANIETIMRMTTIRKKTIEITLDSSIVDPVLGDRISITDSRILNGLEVQGFISGVQKSLFEGITSISVLLDSFILSGRTFF